MNKKKIEDKKMAELMKISLYNSPREILRQLKEIDKGYLETAGRTPMES